jgi:hypothetical protein
MEAARPSQQHDRRLRAQCDEAHERMRETRAGTRVMAFS